jgi:hypothetical protein
MPAPREIIDSLESVLGVYFSGVRHRDRAAFILCDELVEMACKLRAREHNYAFNMRCSFHDAWNAPGVTIPAASLGTAIEATRATRNVMQHASAAATVDDQHCADAILDAIAVIDHCWPSTSTNQFAVWMRIALRVVRLYSSQGVVLHRQKFEDIMRDEGWRNDRRQPRVNEILIRPGLRGFWGHLFYNGGEVQIEQALTRVGAP